MVLRQFPLLPPMHGDLEGWGGGGQGDLDWKNPSLSN